MVAAGGDLRADLQAYIHDGAARPFEWGKCDCLLWVAAWLQIQTGKPAWAIWANAGYDTAIKAHSVLRRHGGVLGLMWRETAYFGLAETSDPRDGDIGVVIDTAGQYVGAIRIGNRWACKTQTGVVVSPFETRQAWSVPRA